MATIRYLAEQAVSDWLNTRTLAAEAVCGTATAVKDAPLIICTATEWEEDEFRLNWFRVKMEIETKSPASEGADDFDSLCDSVRSNLRLTDLGTELGAVQNGLVFPPTGASAPDKGSFTTVDDMLVETRELELYCALTG